MQRTSGDDEAVHALKLLFCPDLDCMYTWEPAQAGDVFPKRALQGQDSDADFWLRTHPAVCRESSQTKGLLLCNFPFWQSAVIAVCHTQDTARTKARWIDSKLGMPVAYVLARQIRYRIYVLQSASCCLHEAAATFMAQASTTRYLGHDSIRYNAVQPQSRYAAHHGVACPSTTVKAEQARGLPRGSDLIACM